MLSDATAIDPTVPSPGEGHPAQALTAQPTDSDDSATSLLEAVLPDELQPDLLFGSHGGVMLVSGLMLTVLVILTACFGALPT
ncbi:hypothetical protein SAMN05445060_0267 [Williamsia sterculiae]|uniref:Uncharacterized protein n=2 Tax=Williamsia sterculiae TaxID=1344003 RepID=A0A1N7CPN0_9NOCA|nr:hypothetical protein SAMN05445060_0267 [Williamsia sterculiae]